ncbi:UPF0149 family protein [Dyella sp. ASV21]|uniref:UPF0149 family protein n=1 Tax=Dyella sp. ASV21 TaxID=2795114 RepID=UPI0018EBA6F5|nr:UPF0149 family protein [Dyella sp. ASV21]
MTTNEPIGYDELDDAVARLQLGVESSELHGSLCGFLSGSGRIAKGALLETLHVDAEAATPSAQDLAFLDTLVQQTEAELADPELGFEPLMPADDRPLPERADALVEWCRGFLGGFGLAGAEAHGKLTDEAQEILRDLGTIASSSFDFGDEGEDEDALIEVHEFVRMGAMLLFAECGRRPASNSDTVH